MMRRLGACLVMSLAIGCGVGGDDGGGDLDPIDPNPNKLTCSDGFKVSGSFTQTEDRPADVEGCWAIGEWKFTASRDTTDDNVLDITGDKQPDRCGSVAGTAAATADPTYTLVVTRIVEPSPTPDPEVLIEDYKLEGQTESGGNRMWNGKVLARMKVTEGGGGECSGAVELYSTDGKQYWNMRPDLSSDGTTLTGFGQYMAYEESQL